MNLLAIDSSGAVCSAAVISNGVLASEIACQNGLKHSITLMPMIEQALELAGTDMSNIGLIAVVNGPGSFTGVRIGVSCARALSLSLDIPVAGVNALEALCAQPFPGTVCAMLDARRDQVYCAAFSGGSRVLPDFAGDVSEFLSSVMEAGGSLLFTGDGSVKHRNRVHDLLGERAIISDAPLRASAAGFLALKSPEKAAPGILTEPYYLRASQAEREAKARG